MLRGAARSLGIAQRMIIEYHSRPLLGQVERIGAENGFVRDEKVEYYPEIAASGQEEVGIVYFRRAAATSSP